MPSSDTNASAQPIRVDSNVRANQIDSKRPSDAAASYDLWLEVAESKGYGASYRDLASRPEAASQRGLLLFSGALLAAKINNLSKVEKKAVSRL